MHRVVALCLDGLVAFDLTAPAQAFGLAARPGWRAALRVLDLLRRAARRYAPPAASRSYPEPAWGRCAGADTVVVPGYAGILAPPPEAALRRPARRRAAAAPGCSRSAPAPSRSPTPALLDGRRATTHWAWAGELAKRFPAIAVDPDALFVDEGEVLTSAGLSAGIDLSLHVIRRDFGAAAGERVARHMVAAAPPRGRPGAVLQGRAARRAAARWSRPVAGPASASASRSTSRRWSRHAGVSPRTFARRFREETGTTPLQWLLGQRVLEARRLLEETALPVETIAWRLRFGTAASLRDHFRRRRRPRRPPTAAPSSP